MNDGENDYLSRIVDEAALADYLEPNLGPADTYQIRHHQEGHSNETLFITWGDEELVLRRPPPGETADTAHDVLREYRVMDALQETDVRVPRTILDCEDHDILGCDFYLMERVEGDVIRETEPNRFTPLERQVERWHDQFEWASEITADERKVPAIATVGDWLDDNRPATYPETLVHGDYKLNNVMYGPADDPEIVGIFDWELSTRGDPRFDLAWLLTYWRDASDPEPLIPELMTRIPEREGHITRGELVNRYEEVAGIEFEHGQFYRALAVYKLAALCEMFFRRYLEGNSDDPMYPKMRDRVPALAEWAKRIVDSDEPL